MVEFFVNLNGVKMKVSKGKKKKSILCVGYGIKGIGKSTFAAGAKDVIFLGPEDGTNELDVSRLEGINTYKSIYDGLEWLKKQNYKSLAVDTLDWIERIFIKKILGSGNSLAKSNGGYGAGYEALLTEFIKFKDAINILRDKKKMNIILLAHCKVKQFNDPQTSQPYDRYNLKLTETTNVSVGGFIQEWVDDVLFMNYEVATTGEGKAARGVSTRTRKMWTEQMPAFDAKNRSSLPFEMPLEWNCYAVAKAFKVEVDETSKEVNERIDRLLLSCDEQVIKNVTTSVTKSKGSVTELQRIETKLKILMEGK